MPSKASGKSNKKRLALPPPGGKGQVSENPPATAAAPVERSNSTNLADVAATAPGPPLGTPAATGAPPVQLAIGSLPPQ